MEKKNATRIQNAKKTNVYLIQVLNLASLILMILLPLLYFAYDNLGMHAETVAVATNTESGWKIPSIVLLALIGYILLSNRRSI